MGKDSCGISEELIEMGFKGLLLNRLLSHIVDADAMQEFFNFIILHEDKRMTKILLAHEFVIYIQNKKSFASSDEFVGEYVKAETQEVRENLITKLLTTEANPLILKKVVKLFDDNNDKLSPLYENVVSYRKKYNNDEIYTLLHTLPI